MRRLIGMLVLVLAVLALATSCSQKVEDGLATVNFTQAVSRDIFASIAYPDVNTLTWSLTAEKLDKGSTTGAGKVEDALLTDEFGPFSVGRWQFTFEGYSDDGVKVYSGSVNATLEQGANSVEVEVTPQGETGTLVLSGCNIDADNPFGTGEPMFWALLSVNGSGSGLIRREELTKRADGLYDIKDTTRTLAPGVHEVCVRVENQDASLSACVASFKVRVEPGLVTTVSFGRFEGKATVTVTVTEHEAIVEEE